MLKALKNVLMVLLVSLFVFLKGYAVPPSDFIPSWHEGDGWDVITRVPLAALYGVSGGSEEESRGAPEDIQFNVLAPKTIDGETCYVLEVSYKSTPYKTSKQNGYYLYVRQTDFTVKQLQRIIINSDGTVKMGEPPINNGHSPAIFSTPCRVDIPLDFPNLSSGQAEPTGTTSTGLVVTQKVSFLDDNTMKVELTADTTGLLKTTQIWQKGKPWWSSVERSLTYTDENGKQQTRVEYDNVLSGVDTTPPRLSVNVNPATIWPPNKRMVQINTSVNATDDYDKYPQVKLESVTSNEPDSSGKDIQIGNNSIFLCADRNGKGNGRVYTITYSATDASGNKAMASATVTVPHDQGK